MEGARGVALEALNERLVGQRVAHLLAAVDRDLLLHGVAGGVVEVLVDEVGGGALHGVLVAHRKGEGLPQRLLDEGVHDVLKGRDLLGDLVRGGVGGLVAQGGGGRDLGHEGGARPGGEALALGGHAGDGGVVPGVQGGGVHRGVVLGGGRGDGRVQGGDGVVKVAVGDELTLPGCLEGHGVRGGQELLAGGHGRHQGVVAGTGQAPAVLAVGLQQGSRAGQGRGQGGAVVGGRGQGVEGGVEAGPGRLDVGVGGGVGASGPGSGHQGPGGRVLAEVGLLGGLVKEHAGVHGRGVGRPVLRNGLLQLVGVRHGGLLGDAHRALHPAEREGHARAAYAPERAVAGEDGLVVGALGVLLGPQQTGSDVLVVPHAVGLKGQVVPAVELLHADVLGGDRHGDLAVEHDLAGLAQGVVAQGGHPDGGLLLTIFCVIGHRLRCGVGLDPVQGVGVGGLSGHGGRGEEGRRSHADGEHQGCSQGERQGA